jgi:hypothetical protein
MSAGTDNASYTANSDFSETIVNDEIENQQPDQEVYVAKPVDIYRPPVKPKIPDILGSTVESHISRASVDSRISQASSFVGCIQPPNSYCSGQGSIDCQRSHSIPTDEIEDVDPLFLSIDLERSDDLDLTIAGNLDYSPRRPVYTVGV